MRSYPLMKILAIDDPEHASDVMSILLFTQVTKPITSSRSIRSQVAETNETIAQTVFIFISKMSVEQTKFICNGGSISRRNLAITLDMYDSEQCKVIYPSCDLHVNSDNHGLSMDGLCL